MEWEYAHMPTIPRLSGGSAHRDKLANERLYTTSVANQAALESVEY